LKRLGEKIQRATEAEELGEIPRYLRKNVNGSRELAFSVNPEAVVRFCARGPGASICRDIEGLLVQSWLGSEKSIASRGRLETLTSVFGFWKVTYMKMPLFCFRIVIIQSRARAADPSKRHAPLQICTPRKLMDTFPLWETDFVSKAPAIGAPINVAMEENPQDIPSRVPRSERSGHILGKAEPGSVTRPAEKKPVNEVVNKPTVQIETRLTHPTMH
jgi:hypothetical protein